MRGIKSRLMALLVAIAPFAAGATETTLTLVTGQPLDQLPAKNAYIFRDQVNASGKGILQIRIVGGPEVTPADKQPDAMRRGIFDIVYGPPAYYKGVVPETSALETNLFSGKELRANGSFVLFNEIYRRRLGAEIIAIPNVGTGMNLYLTAPPKMRPDGLPDLSGMPVRSVSTYRPLITALNGAAVNIPPADVYGAMERHIVQAIPYIGFDYVNLPWFKFVKYRIDPSFLHLVNVIMINGAKWDSLPNEAKDILLRAGINHEDETYNLLHGWVERDTKLAVEKGMKIVTLQGDAARKYRELASNGLWDEVQQLAPGALKALKDKLGR